MKPRPAPEMRINGAGYQFGSGRPRRCFDAERDTRRPLPVVRMRHRLDEADMSGRELVRADGRGRQWQDRGRGRFSAGRFEKRQFDPVRGLRTRRRRRLNVLVEWRDVSRRRLRGLEVRDGPAPGRPCPVDSGSCPPPVPSSRTARAGREEADRQREIPWPLRPAVRHQGTAPPRRARGEPGCRAERRPRAAEHPGSGSPSRAGTVASTSGNSRNTVPGTSGRHPASSQHGTRFRLMAAFGNNCASARVGTAKTAIISQSPGAALRLLDCRCILDLVGR